MAKLTYDVQIAIDGKIPDRIGKASLEDFLSKAFSTRDMQLVSGFLDIKNPYYPFDMSFLVLAQNRIRGDSIAGVLLAESKATDGLTFDYYNKIAVAPERRNNGIMREMIGIARYVRVKDGNVPPAILRTSDPGLSQIYGGISDAVHKIGEFYIHGFGFLDKEGNPHFQGAKEKFGLAAKYAAALPATLIKKT